jgi:hypothetical protein
VLSFRPWVAYADQREKAERHRAEMREAELSREQLMRERARLEPSVGREEQAREQGFVKGGEFPAPGDRP